MLGKGENDSVVEANVPDLCQLLFAVTLKRCSCGVAGTHGLERNTKLRLAAEPSRIALLS